MQSANINDRDSIARIYPPEKFATDAAENAKQPANPFLRGVRIIRGPDAAGLFEVAAATQHVGEAPGTEFVAAFRREQPHDRAMHDPAPSSGYEAFLDEVVAAARKSGLAPAGSPSPGDPRLRGLRQ